MRAMQLQRLCDLNDCAAPLIECDVPDPRPGRGEVLIAVGVCGVCHTELDEIEGRAPPPSLPVIPGHQVVGRIAETGPAARRFSIGDRVGVGWIHSSDGSAEENLSDAFRATGRDVDGGYAEYLVVPEAYAHPIPDAFSDVQAAPLLCAGAVGFRALSLCRLTNGESLGLTGFGGSGHIVLQLARHLFPDTPVFVFARSAVERAFALELGANWSGDTDDAPPTPLHAIIDTTPVWRPVLAALAALRPGGRLVINAIRKQDDDRDVLASLSYDRHLWLEKELKTVANVTAADIARFLPIAAEIPVQVETECFPLSRANDALNSLRRGHLRGAKVLEIGAATR
ncbi:MAG: alcohol dehydrogenase catalytic domain-containing protein [Woeseiaceae bacterium]|nr:alcohol dehydrogenase catalytic domain-containing protein [Woeseiaceae bacterium]